jgi:hypothetical protein
MQTTMKNTNKAKSTATKTWKQMFDFCTNPNVTAYYRGELMTSVQLFWMPVKALYSVVATADDSYTISIVG